MTDETMIIYEDDVIQISEIENSSTLNAKVKNGVTQLSEEIIDKLSVMRDYNIVLPESIKTICEGVFDSFEIEDREWTIVFSDSIECFEEYAFAEANVYFEKLNFKNTISIGNNAFYKYSNFKYCNPSPHLVFSSCLESIGKCAFYACKNLKSVTVNNPNTIIGEDAFGNCHKIIIKAPVGSNAEKYAKENDILFKALD